MQSPFRQNLSPDAPSPFHTEQDVDQQSAQERQGEGGEVSDAQAVGAHSNQDAGTW